MGDAQPRRLPRMPRVCFDPCHVRLMVRRHEIINEVCDESISLCADDGDLRRGV